MLLNDLDQGVGSIGDFPAAACRILCYSTVSVNDLAVFEDEHYGNSYSGLPDRLKAGCYRLSLVNKSV